MPHAGPNATVSTEDSAQIILMNSSSSLMELAERPGVRELILSAAASSLARAEARLWTAAAEAAVTDSALDGAAAAVDHWGPRSSRLGLMLRMALAVLGRRGWAGPDRTGRGLDSLEESSDSTCSLQCGDLGAQAAFVLSASVRAPAAAPVRAPTAAPAAAPAAAPVAAVALLDMIAASTKHVLGLTAHSTSLPGAT